LEILGPYFIFYFQATCIKVFYLLFSTYNFGSILFSIFKIGLLFESMLPTDAGAITPTLIFQNVPHYNQSKTFLNYSANN